MGGINEIKNNQLALYANRHNMILKTIKEELPDCKIYVQSGLLVSEEIERSYCSNATILKFNELIKKLAEDNDTAYIDLNSLFLIDGKMNEELTTGGLHLNEKGYSVWTNAIEKDVTQ